jgi:RimJ/RimL family protein N-acetyltransferase
VERETERLVLRQPSEEDADAFAEAATDPEVMRYIGDGTVGTRDGSLHVIRRYRRFWEEDGFGMFVLERRDEGVVIGRAGLQARNPADWGTGARSEIGSTAEIEIVWILARRHWGQGYATEAALAVRDWAFRELALPRLISLIHPLNRASVRVAEKIGEGYERQVTTGAGKPALLYASARELSRDR